MKSGAGKIDTAATKRRFLDSGRNMSRWAKANDLDVENLRAKINGRRTLQPADIALLERDGLLVWQSGAGESMDRAA